MRKQLLLGASFLLLAFPACNRLEEESVPAFGSVKMSFTAVMDEGDTRTAYQDDKTASWVAGDAISVYVTNGTKGKVVTFTANQSLRFVGEVPDGYSTIVAGAYPADAAHTFGAKGVKTLHLPASYTLAEGADPASILPLAGTFTNGVMSFRHPAGALKFTINNVPATATRFRFTTAGQKVNGDFALDPVLATSKVEAEQSVDINFPAAQGTRSFYVPMPAGELAAGASIALYDADNNILFQKTVPQAMTVKKNVIKRIAAVSVDNWRRNEEWQINYLWNTYSAEIDLIQSEMEVTGTTGLFDFAVVAKGDFETHYGTVEQFLNSSYIADQKAAGAYAKEYIGKYEISRLSPGEYTAVIYGLDQYYNSTGEYNVVEFDVIEFVTPAGWSISFLPKATIGGQTVQAATVKVSAGTRWGFSYTTKQKYDEIYGGDPAVFIGSKRTGTGSLNTRTNATVNLGNLAQDEWVFFVYGMYDRTEEGGLRTPSGAYCMLDYKYFLPTEAFAYWLGEWEVTENDGTIPHTDYWTIETDVLNESYIVTGLCNNTANPKEIKATLDGTTLRIQSQFDLGTVQSTNGDIYHISLVGASDTGAYDFNNYTPYDLMSAQKTDETKAALTGFGYPKYNLLGRVTHESDLNNYGSVRRLPATMTRVTSDSVIVPDDEAVDVIVP